MSKRDIIGANRRNNRPGGFTPSKRNCKPSLYSIASDVKAACGRILDPARNSLPQTPVVQGGDQ